VMIVQRRWPHCLCARDAAVPAEWLEWNAAFLALVQGKKGKPLAKLLRGGRPVPFAAAAALAELLDPTLPWNQFNWRKPAPSQTRRYDRPKCLVGPQALDATPERVLKATIGKTGHALAAAKASPSPAVRLVAKRLSETHRLRLARNNRIVTEMLHEETENRCSTREAAIRVGERVGRTSRHVTDVWEMAFNTMPYLSFEEINTNLPQTRD
jgi:hypothetical protein